MSVNFNPTTVNYGNYAGSGKVNSESAAKTEKKAADTTKTQDGVVYEKTQGDVKNKATYSINKMSEQDRAALVQQMKLDQQNRIDQLSSLVQKMFSKQAGVSKLADLFTAENLKNVSAEDIAKAKEDVSEDGYFGVKQTSQRMFDFASALAGDDVEKMKEMQAAVEKGFKQATKSWGGDLPSICQDTLSATNQLFEDYYNSKA